MDIQNLANLLKVDEEEGNRGAEAVFTPGSIGTSKKEEAVVQPETSINDNGDIWGDEELDNADLPEEFEDGVKDGRVQPQYDILYRQKVTSDDCFLGMSGKNPSTACCEDLVLKIELPLTQQAEINLDVKDKYVLCRTHKYRLALYLPHEVDSSKGKANWNSVKEVLELVLPMRREYDFMNFQ